jgi:hypothetical protein
MCTELLPPGGYPIAVNKYIISYNISYHHIISYIIYIVSYIILYHILSAQGIQDHITFLEYLKSGMLVFCIGNTKVGRFHIFYRPRRPLGRVEV